MAEPRHYHLWLYSVWSRKVLLSRGIGEHTCCCDDSLRDKRYDPRRLRDICESLTSQTKESRKKYSQNQNRMWSKGKDSVVFLLQKFLTSESHWHRWIVVVTAVVQTVVVVRMFGTPWCAWRLVNAILEVAKYVRIQGPENSPTPCRFRAEELRQKLKNSCTKH